MSNPISNFSYLTNAGSDYVEGLYNDYRSNPESVDPEWKRFFEGFEFANTQFLKTNLASKVGVSSNGNSVGATGQVSKEISVLNLIYAYRSRGHLCAKTNPVFPDRLTRESDLEINNFDLSEVDLDTEFQAGNQIHAGKTTLRNIIKHLEDTYCRTIGVEHRHIRRPECIAWLEDRMEARKNNAGFSIEKKKDILKKVGQANTFENFLHRRFVGQKRFSLEGGEALIPALDECINHGARLGNREFIIGMAHRGRLNVLVNTLRKEYDNVFSEFEGKGLSNENFDGDVKYHLGFSADIVVDGNIPVHLSLTPNPSHLEAVNPVVGGVARAKMDNLYESDSQKVCPILIHGDASLSGQGIVYEMIQMSGLRGFQTGGTVHIVINNQIGFTTDPSDSRTSTYCTDVAKVTLSPVFHVNGDDAEAVVYVTQLAMDYRQQFGSDVFVDIVCYRKYGHNEGDEPRFTNPLLYNAISNKLNPFEVYAAALKAEGSIDEAHLQALETELKDFLNKEWEESKVNTYEIGAKPKRLWEGISYYVDNELEEDPNTRVDEKIIRDLAEKITKIPQHLTLHKNVAKILHDRYAMIFPEDATSKNSNAEKIIDWGMVENLTYASLLNEGRPVRITGQDVERGTFSHRHAIVKDINTQECYCPLRNIGSHQAPIHIYNSHLSEYAVMGFEFGYSLASPHTLTIWEAQYGDFCNGAQIIIDQFISACKTKWQRMSGLVLLLPHGYEGGGPEHSSARLERFLTLVAENNMYVCNLTTPANLFHALRRQINSNVRRPLVIFSPKSLLKLSECKSSMDDLTKGQFEEIIDDEFVKVKNVKSVIVCTGKIYYDLLKERNKQALDHIAIVRLEQIYPLQTERWKEIIKKYNKKDVKWVWAQEEPLNMGAWAYVNRKITDVHWIPIGRKESASPATATAYQHMAQQNEIISKALHLVEVKEPVA